MFYRSHSSLVQRAEVSSRARREKLRIIRIVAGGLLVTLMLFSITTAAQAQGIHRVRVGETLGSIAAQYGTSINALASQNGIANPNHIYVGQQLSIPNGMRSASSSSRNVTVSKRNWTALSYVSSASTMACRRSARQNEMIHYVRAGDTLSGIASRYGVGLASLRSTNSLWSDRIGVGQCLIIPSGLRATPAPDRSKEMPIMPAVVTPASIAMP